MKLVFLILFSAILNCYGQGTTPMFFANNQMPTATDCPAGQTYRWKFSDGSGSTVTGQCGGINATTFNSPTWGTYQLAFLASSSQYASTGNSSAFDFGTSSFSLSFWIKTNTASQGVLGNLNDEGGSVYRGYGFYIYPNSGGSYNGLNFGVYGDGGTSEVIFGSNAAIADNVLHNIIMVLTRTGSGSSTTVAMTLYIDGSAVSQGGTGTFGSPASTVVGDISSSGDLMFGSNPFYQSLSLYYTGDLGDVRIFQSAINSTTASAIYAAGKGGNF